MSRAQYSRTLNLLDLKCLQLAIEGNVDGDIARMLGRSASTITNRFQRVMSKLGAQTRTHMVAIAFREGLVE